MEWCVVAIALSLSLPPSSAQTGCSARCVWCEHELSLLRSTFSTQLNTKHRHLHKAFRFTRVRDVDSQLALLDLFNGRWREAVVLFLPDKPQYRLPSCRVTCTLECEGILSSVTELEKCQKVLEYSADLLGLSERNEFDPSRSEMEDALGMSVGALVKRYGGFLKKVLKKERSLLPDDAHLKSLLTKKSRNSSSRFGESDIPSTEQDAQQEADSSENEPAVYDDDADINEVKRYGGFFRKHSGRRSSVPEDESGPEVFQKRYGGFMRRIRPQKSMNQKRYENLLQHNFKISARSDEDPGFFGGFDR